MNKDKIGNYLFVLVVLHTLFYVSMYAFQIYGFSKVVAVFSIPLLMLSYFFKSSKIDYLYLLAILLVFVGDVINSFWVLAYDWSVFLYGLNLAYYGYYLLRELGARLTGGKVILVAVPYVIAYACIFYNLADSIEGMSMEMILFYNFFLGVFSIASWMKLIYKRCVTSIYLFISSSSVVLMSILYLVNRTGERLRILDDVVINLLFLSFHLFMYLYVLRKEKQLAMSA